MTLCELFETDVPAVASPENEICPCGHEGTIGSAMCFICYYNMMHEIATTGHARLMATNNASLMLQRLGLSRTSVWRSLKRGWFTLPGSQDNVILDSEPGGFAELNDPYAFAHSQVAHILNLWGVDLQTRSLAEDMVQEGLLKCWELRHKQGIRNWPAFFSTVIRRKVQDLLPRELKYELWGIGEDLQKLQEDN